jgi:hypothetical protein
MLSPGQAVKEWERVLQLLAEIKAHIVEHPDNHALPPNLEARFNGSFNLLKTGLASPVASPRGSSCSKRR